MKIPIRYLPKNLSKKDKKTNLVCFLKKFSKLKYLKYLKNK